MVAAVSKLCRAVIAAGAVLLAGGTVGACGGGSGDVVARVGKTAIAVSAFDHWMSVRAAMAPQATSALGLLARSAPRRWTIDFLIASARSVGMAEEDGIKVTDAEAESALDRSRYEQIYGLSSATGQGELAALLSSKAETSVDRLWIAKVHLLAARVEARQRVAALPKVTDSQVADYFARNKARFVVPERRDVVVIETFARAKAEQAKREIESGRGLIDVMTRRNDEPDVGGLKLGLSRNLLRHSYEKNYFSSKLHRLVGPLRSEIYYLFEVTRIVPARTETLSEVQFLIRQRLAAAGQRARLAAAMRMLERRWKAVTRCAAAYLVPECGAKLE
jgi:hypothetical protein